jgi:hypothetical protein
MGLGYAQDAGRDPEVYPQVLLLYGVIAFAVCHGSTSSVGRSLPNAVRSDFPFAPDLAVALLVFGYQELTVLSDEEKSAIARSNSFALFPRLGTALPPS